MTGVQKLENPWDIMTGNHNMTIYVYINVNIHICMSPIQCSHRFGQMHPKAHVVKVKSSAAPELLESSWNKKPSIRMIRPTKLRRAQRKKAKHQDHQDDSPQLSSCIRMIPQLSSRIRKIPQLSSRIRKIHHREAQVHQDDSPQLSSSHIHGAITECDGRQFSEGAAEPPRIRLSSKRPENSRAVRAYQGTKSAHTPPTNVGERQHSTLVQM